MIKDPKKRNQAKRAIKIVWKTCRGEEICCRLIAEK